MRNIRYLTLGCAALVLASCMPGGIYKQYQDQDIELKDIAVLDWSMCKCSVSRIDGKSVETGSGLWVRVDHAHLLPGSHAVTVWSKYQDLFRGLILHVDLRPGGSYEVKQAPCFKCNPFEAKIWIEDTASGVKLAQKTTVGIGKYGEARRCRSDCRQEDCGAYTGYAERECRMRRSFCESDCDRLYAPHVDRGPGKEPKKTTFDVSVKVPRREVPNGDLLALVKVDDQRAPGVAAGTREAAFGITMGVITFYPPETQIVKNFLEVELTEILRAKGIQLQQEFSCDLLQFNVHADATLLYWDVVGGIRLILTQNGEEHLLSGQYTQRDYSWPGEEVIGKVVAESLKEIGVGLRERFMPALGHGAD
jgi:hypothetical protein